MKNYLKLLRDNATVERAPVNLVRNEATAEATLYLYDVISDGWGISAMDVINALANIDPATTALRLRIKSPGGDVFEARAIVTAMREFRARGGKIVAQVDAVAASAASWIALAATEVEMVDGSFLMIHKAAGGAWGTDEELRKHADLLTLVEGSIVAEYVALTKNEEAQVRTWMADETWFTAQQALDNGFATRIVSRLADQPGNLAKLSWNLSAYDKAPEALLNLSKPTSQLDEKALLENNQRRLRLLDLNA